MKTTPNLIDGVHSSSGLTELVFCFFFSFPVAEHGVIFREVPSRPADRTRRPQVATTKGQNIENISVLKDVGAKKMTQVKVNQN